MGKGFFFGGSRPKDESEHGLVHEARGNSVAVVGGSDSAPTNDIRVFALDVKSKYSTAFGLFDYKTIAAATPSDPSARGSVSRRAVSEAVPPDQPASGERALCSAVFGGRDALS